MPAGGDESVLEQTVLRRLNAMRRLSEQGIAAIKAAVREKIRRCAIRPCSIRTICIWNGSRVSIIVTEDIRDEPAASRP
jgi:hypothetical protein